MPTAQHPQGNLIQADFFDNTGGLNITDTPFRVIDTQAISGYNYDYTSTGGIKKRSSHTQLNASPDAQLQTNGMWVHNTFSNGKTLLRAATTGLQTVNTSSGLTTLVPSDASTATTSFFSSVSHVNFSQFNSTTANLSWLAGAGQGNGILTGFTGSFATQNGAMVPVGSLSLSTTTSGGNLPGSVSYVYAVAFHKLSTGAVSNAALDVGVATGTGSTNSVTVTLSHITTFDTTKYDQIYVYRSAVGGSLGFTTGDLVTMTSSSTTSFLDTGAVQNTGIPVPRAGNTGLDNSVLPTVAQCNSVTTWKRRLVTAQNSTLYISDLNKSESWPTFNYITIPSGGAITGLAVIQFNTSTTTGTDEFLCVFKENELWMVSGDDNTDWSLQFVDYCGVANQGAVVLANGFLFWMNYRGVFMWDASNKPIYLSQPIEFDFTLNGDVSRATMSSCVGTFFRKQNEIIWSLGSTSLGLQKLQYKLDLRLSLSSIGSGFVGRITPGVFIKDSSPFPIQALSSTLPTFDETVYAGDSSGFIYTLYSNQTTDAGIAIPFNYTTKTLDLGSMSTIKRFHKVIVWCQNTTSNYLTMNYWVNYLINGANQATQYQQLTSSTTSSLWDQALWDQSSWDQLLITYTPLVFNMGNATIGVEGRSLTLQFVQNDPSTPLIIGGFSIIYSNLGLRD